MEIVYVSDLKYMIEYELQTTLKNYTLPNNLEEIIDDSIKEFVIPRTDSRADSILWSNIKWAVSKVLTALNIEDDNIPNYIYNNAEHILDYI